MACVRMCWNNKECKDRVRDSGKGCKDRVLVIGDDLKKILRRVGNIEGKVDMTVYHLMKVAMDKRDGESAE